jgi:Tfp pilus assembly protein PilV
MRLPFDTRARKCGDPGGFTLVEVVIAAFVVAVGIAGFATAFNSSRRLTLLSERRGAMAHRAQLELERLQSYAWGELAMASAPPHSNEKNNPDYYVNSAPTKCVSENDGCYAWNMEATGEEETLVPAKNGECKEGVTTECGVVAALPSGRGCSAQVGACEWSDGLVEGRVYDFVTWHRDSNCTSCSKKEKAAKRLTVVVTGKVPGSNHEPALVHVSTLVTESG